MKNVDYLRTCGSADSYLQSWGLSVAKATRECASWVCNMPPPISHLEEAPDSAQDVCTKGTALRDGQLSTTHPRPSCTPVSRAAAFSEAPAHYLPLLPQA
jgi:hypothetical protein